MAHRLTGLTVTINPHLTTDPASRQGQQGIVENEKNGVFTIRFADGEAAMYNDETCFDELPDERNPQYLFSLTSNDLLSKIVTGEIDAKELAWQTLRNRGMDKNGKWVGFPKEGKAEPEKPFGKMFF